MAVAHRRLLPTLALALLPVFTAVSCKADVSGMYIARFTNGVWWLQIVQTPDSRLSAQLETILLTKDDRVSREKISLSGAANGIGLTLSATTMGISVVTLSGQLEGARLTVTGGEPSPMVFVRSTLRDYASAVRELEGEAQLGIALKDYERFLSDVESATTQMHESSKEADIYLAKLPKAEEFMHSITTKMAEYVERERRLSDNPKASVYRGQIAVDVSQGPVTADQLKTSVQVAHGEFSASVGSVVAKIKPLRERCLSGNLLAVTGGQQRAAKHACESLSTEANAYRQKLDLLNAAFSHSEQIYLKESRAQQDLVKESERYQ